MGDINENLANVLLFLVFFIPWLVGILEIFNSNSDTKASIEVPDHVTTPMALKEWAKNVSEKDFTKK